MENNFWVVTHLPLQAMVQRDGWGLLWKIMGSNQIIAENEPGSTMKGK